MKSKKFIATLIIAMLVNIVNFSVVFAQDENIQLETDPEIGLQTITIPFFPQIELIDAEFATFLSWASFIGNLAIVGLIAFWIYRIIVAGLKAMKSEGDPEGLAEAWKQTRSVFIGAGLTFIIPIVLSIVGAALQVGPIWNWPLAFRECKDDRYDYYFQAVEAFGEEGSANKAEIDAICF